MSLSPFVESVSAQAKARINQLPGADLAWLNKTRHDQLQALIADGMPTLKTEEWKYTALRALERQRFTHGDEDAQNHSVDAASLDLPGADGVRLVFVNGLLRKDLSQLEDLPEGLQVVPLAQMIDENAEALRFYLARDWHKRADAFARLNAAFAADGVVLKVAAGAKIDKPVHLVMLGCATDTPVASHLHHVVEIGEAACLSLVEHYLDQSPNANLSTHVMDTLLHEKAQLDWVMLQDASPKSILVRQHNVRQQAHSEIMLHAFEGGGKLARNDLDIKLVGEKAALHTRGVFLPHGRQHMDTHLDITHDTKDSYSDALWRGVADQGGHGVFHGQINVMPGADGTDASLYNKNLLLSRKAMIDTQPALLIYAEEVMAMHGATVGQLDDMALFYLRSRGIPADVARNMLTAAFCRAALTDVANESLRDYLMDHLVDVLPNLEAV